MIKSLLEPDEKQSAEVEAEREETTFGESKIGDEEFEKIFADIEAEPAATNESENLPENIAPMDDALISVEEPQTSIETPIESANESPDFPASTDNQTEEPSAETETYESNSEFPSDEADTAPLAGFPVEEADSEILNQTASVKNTYEPFEIPKESVNFAAPVEVADDAKSSEPNAEAATTNIPSENSETIFQTPAEPESFAETARRSGLAYAAAITLFGSIVFMLIIGWFADLLLGSSPFGIVGGIILGALIGFVQFFRLTSQIFKGEK